jgi:hypothetical protein
MCRPELSGGKHNDIEAHAFGWWTAQPGKVEIRGAGDAVPLAREQRFARIAKGAAGFHFDKAQNAARAQRHKIDLASVRAQPARENAVALGDQQNCRDSFSVPAAAFGFAPTLEGNT